MRDKMSNFLLLEKVVSVITTGL